MGVVERRGVNQSINRLHLPAVKPPFSLDTNERNDALLLAGTTKPPPQHTPITLQRYHWCHKPFLDFEKAYDTNGSTAVCDQ